MMSQMTAASPLAATTGEGESGLFNLSAEGMVIGIPFDLALQQLLTAQGGEGEMQLFALQQPGEVDTPPISTTLLTQEGKLLPLSLQADGKALPLVSEQPLTTGDNPESILPLTVKLPQRVQTEIVQQRMISAEKPLDVVPLLSGEDSKPLLESGRVSDTGTHSSLSSLTQIQTLSAGGGSRPSIALPLNTPVGQPGWDKAVGERIQWMVNQNVQQAEIKLTPPNLGPMEIKISLQNDQTSVTFIATQAPTREALEASIPRLREMFGEINLNLANVDVGHRQASESGREGAEQEAQGNEPAVDHEHTVKGWSADLGSTTVLNGDGLLDTYA
jgi:hypothetical protein